MRLVPELAMMLSGICIIGFFVSEMGFSQIPVLYPIGVWLHEYWFADYHERYKRHYGQYVIDGPPLIVTPGDSGPQNWPYAAAAPNTLVLQPAIWQLHPTVGCTYRSSALRITMSSISHRQHINSILKQPAGWTPPLPQPPKQHQII